MTKSILITVIAKLLTVCRKEGIKIVFTGGIAVNVFGRPRTTYDVDGLFALGEEKVKGLLNALAAAGFAYDRRQPVRYIQGMPFITLVYRKTYVDLFLAQSPFQVTVLTRAHRVKFGRLTLRVAAPEDLVILKLLSGRERDTEDVREILTENAKSIDFNYLKRSARKLGVITFLKDELRSLGGGRYHEK